MDHLGTWSDMGSGVILPDAMHKIFELYFLRVAARILVSFYHCSDV
jgi:hypothetical protein